MTITSVSSRRAIAQIRNSGVRVRRGPIGVSYLAGTSSVAVAFAVPKSIGSAVVRNRIRRRLRAVFNELVKDDSNLVESGDYLVSVTSPLAQLSYLELRSLVTHLLQMLKYR